MLNSLVIKNFRALEDFTVSKLGRVNLIVGKNNSGKSSVLEALRIYAGNARLSLLESIAAGHDEKFLWNEIEGIESETNMPFEGFFTGRRFPDDETPIVIGESTASEQALLIQHVYLAVTEEIIDESERGVIRNRIRRVVSATSIDSLTDARIIDALSVKKGDQQSLIEFNTYAESRFRSPKERSFGITPCSIVPTNFISTDELSEEWDKIALFAEYEDVTKQAMRIILPEFENIAFVKNDVPREAMSRHTMRRDQRTAKVQLSNLPRPVSLNSLGDGMLRILQVVLKIFSAKGGFLLIDEFENGLHYSIQEKIWALLFEMAEKLDIQVFATTHSWDCIESFTKVAIDNETTEGVLFRMGRSAKTSNRGQIIATVFDKNDLFSMTQADIELR